MNNVRCVRCGQRRCDLNANVQDFKEFQASSQHPLIQTFAFNEFSSEELETVALTKLVNRENVWMI